MSSTPSEPIAPSISISYQSTVAEKSSRKLGVHTMPKVVDSDSSGARFALPPCRLCAWSEDSVKSGRRPSAAQLARTIASGLAPHSTQGSV